MVRKRYETIDCPFCKKGKIEIIILQERVVHKRSHISSKTETITFRRPDTEMILTPKCPICGKSEKEIREALKNAENKQMTHSERLERLKKRGLPLVIGNK